MYHRVTLIVLGIAVLFAIHSAWSVYLKQRESADLKTSAEKNFSELSAEDAELQNEINALQTNYGVEREIRSKFNVAKEDENVAIVLDDTDNAALASTTSLTFWQKVLNFLHI